MFPLELHNILNYSCHFNINVVNCIYKGRLGCNVWWADVFKVLCIHAVHSNNLFVQSDGVSQLMMPIPDKAFSDWDSKTLRKWLNIVMMEKKKKNINRG